jgi:hypothetical protein
MSIRDWVRLMRLPLARPDAGAGLGVRRRLWPSGDIGANRAQRRTITPRSIESKRKAGDLPDLPYLASSTQRRALEACPDELSDAWASVRECHQKYERLDFGRDASPTDASRVPFRLTDRRGVACASVRECHQRRGRSVTDRRGTSESSA